MGKAVTAQTGQGLQTHPAAAALAVQMGVLQLIRMALMAVHTVVALVAVLGMLVLRGMVVQGQVVLCGLSGPALHVTTQALTREICNGLVY
jgi:hypothetical protein